MKKIIFILPVIAFLNCPINAQVKLQLIIRRQPQMYIADTIYAAGNFNTWNPSDKNYVFKKADDGSQYIDLQLAPGNYEYKLTRGSWNKTESTDSGKGILNRIINLSKDTTVNISVNGWSDHFKQEVIIKKHTASFHVTTFDSAFYMPQLKRNRRIWLYFPADYYQTKKRFPVLYMHDGQNLFDEFTAGFGEWGIDEFLDSIFMKGKKECIVVGIENGIKRMNEYNPYDFSTYGKGEGNAYVDFIVNTLKPYIDAHLRTLSNKKYTFIAGSSMGGLISLYAVMKYPKVFGGAGIFSPAFWTAADINIDLRSSASKMRSKIFFYAGGKESNTMIPDMRAIESEIKALSSSKIYEEIDTEAQHNEAAWKKYFPDFYRLVISN